MSEKRINTHPSNQAKSVGVALSALKKFVLEGGIIDPEWIYAGGPVPYISPEGHQASTNVITILECASRDYTENVEVIMHPYQPSQVGKKE